MAGQPSEADIATFCEWTALVAEGTGIILDHDRAMATVALKVRCRACLYGFESTDASHSPAKV